jgi:ABC-2 type transport system permease protein
MLLRMRAEEADGPLEQILGTAVSRSRWMISHVINAALGSLVLLLVYAIGVGLTAGAVLGDIPVQLRDMLVAGVVQLPAILLIAGVVVVATALLPRWASAVCWTAVIVFILLGPLFGAATFQLPEWTQNLSPFAHTPKLPGADVTAVPVVALIAIAAALAAAGVATFRRRNLTLPA